MLHCTISLMFGLTGRPRGHAGLAIALRLNRRDCDGGREPEPNKKPYKLNFSPRYTRRTSSWATISRGSPLISTTPSWMM